MTQDQFMRAAANAIAEGRIDAILKEIEALCNNPHWTSDRRWRIADLVQEAQRLRAAQQKS